jgi:hypothetical protein
MKYVLQVQLKYARVITYYITLIHLNVHVTNCYIVPLFVCIYMTYTFKKMIKRNEAKHL